MAKNYNPGTINLDAATKSILSSGGGISEKTKSILSSGGGISEKTKSDGITHVSVYSTTENRHLSYDKDKDGNISNVHTDKDNCAYMDYKGGK